MESLQNILITLSPRLPIPSMKGWTILPDSSSIIINQILAYKPNFILELGSGISTILAAYALEKNGKGKIVSIDHDSFYAQITLRRMKEHNFSTSLFEIIPSALKPQNGQNGTFIWYDTKFIHDLKEPIDLVIIDGPPHKTQKNARYPAIPLLYEKLSPNAIIVLDDASRKDEIEIVQQWISEYPDFSLEHINTAKGVAVLTRGQKIFK